MSYTSHGHHIAGTSQEGLPNQVSVVRCGGPSICAPCALEVVGMQNRVLDAESEGDSDSHRLANGLIIRPERDPAVKHFAKHFAFGHLPLNLRIVSQRFAHLAQYLIDTQSDSPELIDALRNLWNAKNNAVLNAGFLKRS